MALFKIVAMVAVISMVALLPVTSQAETIVVSGYGTAKCNETCTETASTNGTTDCALRFACTSPYIAVNDIRCGKNGYFKWSLSADEDSFKPGNCWIYADYVNYACNLTVTPVANDKNGYKVDWVDATNPEKGITVPGGLVFYPKDDSVCDDEKY